MTTHSEEYRQYHRNWAKKNSASRQENTRQWMQNNPMKVLESQIRRKLKHLNISGLSLETYLIIDSKQQGTCGICNRVPYKRLSIDHCHKTNKFRGLLCNKCNTGLGYFEDDVIKLENAIRYLLNERT